MLTEESVIDQMTVDEYGTIAVRRADRVLRDGVVIATTYHRHVVAPDADVKGEHPRVQAIAAVARKDAKPRPPREDRPAPSSRPR